MISHRPGRPMRYTKLIHNLEDRTLYSVDRIVRLGMRTGFLTQDHFAQDGLATARRRAFDALTKFRIAHLAADPDGTVVNRDDVPRPAWYGCRWKLALPVSYFPDPGTRTDLEALLTELETGNPQNPNVSTDGDREPRTAPKADDAETQAEETPEETPATDKAEGHRMRNLTVTLLLLSLAVVAFYLRPSAANPANAIQRDLARVQNRPEMLSPTTYRLHSRFLRERNPVKRRQLYVGLHMLAQVGRNEETPRRTLTTIWTRLAREPDHRLRDYFGLTEAVP